jgi:hypothetical protein
MQQINKLPGLNLIKSAKKALSGNAFAVFA